MQTAAPGAYRSTMHCFMHAFRHEGVGGLFRGLLPPVASVGALNAMLFASYGACRRAIQPDPAAQLTYLETFLCGPSWSVRQASLPLTSVALYFRVGRRGGDSGSFSPK